MLTPQSASVFRGLSESFSTMDGTLASKPFFFRHQFFIRQTDSIIVENLLLSVVSVSRPELSKKQHVITCLLQSLVKSSAWWRWADCRASWLLLPDDLRFQITGLKTMGRPRRPYATVVIVCALCVCLMIAADCNYCSVRREKKGRCLLILPPTKHPAARRSPR